ncbi:GNAT family N-acetyltransferase [Pantoea allii]|uniref:Phosphinothricin acetyltransferase n=1 Tax=Pantoea allii TaxID=574096 RepID=A0A2V2BK84_9GAMM|nr:GNAT family N-acetyltransferase [Pantoea allii]MCH9297284.1 GNAT family N-acetyltransferase [Pantoea allii]MDJ0035927.1 GNAT family N-acetyltransferase [Pantoea allii]MDJ0039723.1 GNAT family N-acetyltransferase [Pantoea allii]MDJ0088627.1 GNAT family N-acetyltransferase [Pantoea allii]NQS85997.1 N-acetyltransferase [Pantoea allii]
MKIILAEDSHVPAIHQIYAYHVLQGTGSFEIVPPDEAEIASRLEKLRAAGLPWFVAVSEGQVCGYCYLGFYRPRYAYRFTLEDSLYIDPAFQGKGIGKRLLAHAIDWAETRGFRQMVGNVGDSANAASIALHRAAGFSVIGTLTSVGFKHGRWLDTVLMQRALGAGDGSLPENEA